MKISVITPESSIRALTELLDSSKYSMLQLVFPHFKQTLVAMLKWGFFTNKAPVICDKSTPQILNGADLLGAVSPELLEKLKDSVAEYSYPIFAPSVLPKIYLTGFNIYVDSSEAEVDVRPWKAGPEGKLNEDCEITAVLSLPCAEALFNELLDAEDDQAWTYEFQDLYDTLRSHLMDTWFLKMWQIGGYGNWRQGAYDDQYICQINTGVGDNGAVFVLTVGPDIKGHIDMC